MAAKRKTSKKAGKGARINSEAKRPDRKPDGRFVPGHGVKSPGRPRGVDFRKAVEKHAAENKLDMDKAAWEVAEAMRTKAINGDVNAAKLWLDRCCGVQTQPHSVKAETTATVNLVEATREDLKGIARNGQVQEDILDELQRRTHP